MLSAIYMAFADESTALACACGPGCTTCCTRNVTLTTGEGRLIVDFLQATGRSLPVMPHDTEPLRPTLTSNGLAVRYLSRQDVVEEVESPWLFEPCFLLQDGLCSIYPARPFACRSFFSTINCKDSGMAEVPDWLVTLTIVTNQLLEHLDRGGWWGNLADVLAFLDEGAGEDARLAAQERLLPNRPSPGLLVVPEELEMVKSYQARLGRMAGLDLESLNFK